MRPATTIIASHVPRERRHRTRALPAPTAQLESIKRRTVPPYTPARLAARAAPHRTVRPPAQSAHLESTRLIMKQQATAAARARRARLQQTRALRAPTAPRESIRISMRPATTIIANHVLKESLRPWMDPMNVRDVRLASLTRDEEAHHVQTVFQGSFRVKLERRHAMNAQLDTSQGTCPAHIAFLVVMEHFG